MPVSYEEYEFSDKELLLECSTLEDPVPSLPDLEAFTGFLTPARKAVVSFQRASKAILCHGGLVFRGGHALHRVRVGTPLVHLSLSVKLIGDGRSRLRTIHVRLELVFPDRALDQILIGGVRGELTLKIARRA